jgi:hypothetical protein
MKIAGHAGRGSEKLQNIFEMQGASIVGWA